MAITTADLKFYRSERHTQEDDAGGQMSGNAIVSGESNQIFDDISDVARAAGAFHLAKIYPAVTSADTDKYLDSGTVIFRPPADPYTNVLQFSTGDYYDERGDWVGMLESSVSRGRRYAGWLYGMHITGQRALLIWMRPGNDEPPSAGSRLNIAAIDGVELHNEFVWVTKVTLSSRTITDTQGQFVVDEITCDLAYPLQNAYTGIDPARYDPVTTEVSGLIYEVRYNPDMVQLTGIKSLALDASTGDYSIKTSDGIYQQIIPTGLQETAIADTTPAADNALIVAGAADSGTTMSLTTTLSLVKPDGTLFVGGPVLPGSMTMTVSGATLTDLNGTILLGGTTVIGSLDYGNGIARFNSSCPNYGTASKTMIYRPAVKVIRVGQTASMRVTAENRGYVYLLSLLPIPTPGSLRVSYQVNKVWYTIYENGNGLLSGVDSSYGSGNLNGITGTVAITTGALPDIDSDILLVWGTQTEFTQRGNLELNPIKITGTVVNGLPIRRGSFSLSWGSVTVTDDEKGVLAGTGGDGIVNYTTGAWEITPAVLPASGVEIAADYEYITEGVRSYTFDYTNTTVNVDDTITVTVPALTDDWEPKTIQLDVMVITTGLPAPDSTDAEGGRLTDAGVTYRYHILLHDDGIGGLLYEEIPVGTVDYETHAVTFDPAFYGTLGVKSSYYSYKTIGTWVDPETQEITEQKSWVFSWIDNLMDTTVWLGEVSSSLIPYNTLTYNLVTDFPDVESETLTVNLLQLDVTRGFEETISGVEFSIGSSRFVELNRQIFLNPNLETGTGTLAGTLDATTGAVRLNAWTAGATNAPVVKSLVTSRNVQLVSSVIFRTPVANIRPGSLQIRAYTETGTLLSDVVPLSGILVTTDWTIGVDYPNGVVRIRFGLWKTVSTLTSEELLEPWYDADAVVNIGGVDKIWKPTMVRAESVIYNAVAQSILPPDRDMIGIDAGRLPPDGNALIFQQGKLALIHHTDTIVETSLSPTQGIDCGRVRLYRVVIDDSDGQRLPASFYTVNRELGTVTMSPTLDLTGYSGSYTISHTVADLVRLTAVDISGTLTLNKPLSHEYPADESYASGVLFIGTLQARYTNLFAQSTWTSVWSDSLIGSAPLAQYNDTAYPIVVSNAGTYKDRILVKFTSATAFQVIGEQLGVIATGDVTTNCSPVNQLTGQPYFTIDYRGWGSGWATGNCLRGNFIGANYPVDLIRAVQPSDPTGLDDSVELLFIGNTDAT